MAAAADTPAAEYPLDQVVDIPLRDGSSVRLRPVERADRDALCAFLKGLSQESIIFRFFGSPALDRMAASSVDVDYSNRYAIVAELGRDRTLVAHGTYIRTGERKAEVAFVVADRLQGRGISSMMLVHLAAVARAHGIERFVAYVMGGNLKMLNTFHHSGFPVESRYEDGAVRIEFPTALSEPVLDAFDLRERNAAASAVRSVLAPRSLAVIGASARPKTVGGELVHNVVEAGFTGPVYPVNRSGGTIAGLAAYASIDSLPEVPELAVVAVPAAGVCDVARECARLGVRALVVISAGFGEVGEEGRARQQELLEICRASGMRLVGPNCLGVINTDPAVRLDATFAARHAAPGRIGFLSQSGGLGIALIEAADRLGIGLSSFVSVGNKADLSGNDLLEYWEEDPATDVILLYLESFGNPRRFARIARRVSASKPIIAVKSGRSPAGAKATSSHTGAMLAASDTTVDALFRQAGVIRTDTIGELLDTAALLSGQPVPRGRRVAIVTNGGGPGIVTADACQAAGLDVDELPADVRGELTAFLPPGASVINPVDMIATATAADYGRAIEVLAKSGACDAIIALFVPPLMTQAADVAGAIESAAEVADGVTIASVFLDRDLPRQDDAVASAVPRFQFPEEAVRALAHAAGYGAWRARPSGTVRAFDDIRHADASAIIDRSLAQGGGWLAPAEVSALLECYGLPLTPTRVVHGERTAARAAAELGLPVVLKAIAPGLVHKSDCGAVRLGLRDERQVKAAARAIRRSVARAGFKLEGFVVQPMSPPGVELLLGVVHDASFGPVIACGAGGTIAEVQHDVAVRITPLTDLDAHEMLTSLRMFPLLDGYRGTPQCDVGAVQTALLRLSALVEAHPGVAELDANPLIAGPDGAVIVDARIRVEPAPTARPLGALRG
jgi:acetate---CoA ligase (ADP-forming)